MQTMISLGRAEAQAAIDRIAAEAEARRVAVVIAVADVRGELLALLRLDGAAIESVLIATNKAWTAARTGKSTRDIGQSARSPDDGFDVAYFGDARYIGWGGGVPVRSEGRVVGAVAVSGATEAEDIELAELGIAAIG